MIQLIDQINSSFEKNHFTLAIFIDLSKAFDIVDHHIKVSNLENYGLNGNNLRWFQSYLKDYKQYLNFSYKIANLSYICILYPIMFFDNTNHVYSHKNINQLFTKVTEELEKTGKWFKANKLPLNNEKNKYMLCRKNSIKDDSPLELTD